MDDETIHRLNQINQDFYRITANSFDQSRQHAWPGWEALLEYLKPPLNVLDVGCGNGRFGLFLVEYLGTDIRYHGIDNSPRLLERANQALTAVLPNLRLEERDIVENPPDEGQYDLVALFGVLHHIPGFERRQALMRVLAEQVAPGGLLAFACWRFYEYERFRRRIIPWSPGLQVEPNDFLLDWQRGEPAVRYCHYVDDAEHAALVAGTGLTEITTYRADGDTGDVNRYSILRRINP
jgi:tRNA (uracil-5-)-methyltransferase TRM9